MPNETSDRPSPFAGLANVLAESRLSGAAASANLLNREQFRLQDRSRRAAQTNETATPSSAAAAPQPAAAPAPGVPAPAATTSFAALAAMRKVSALTSQRTFAARSISTQQPARAGTGLGGLSKSAQQPAADDGPSLEDLVAQDDVAPTPSSASGNRMFGRAARSTATSEPPKKQKLVYTDEQNEIIHCNDKLIVVDAFAGCAKTTTAIGYADHHKSKRMVYLCLNTANAEEARSRFGPNVTPLTTHQVAFQATRPDRNRLTQEWRPLLLMDQLKLNNSRLAMLTMKTLANFFNSSDVEISEKHAEPLREAHDLGDADVMNAVSYARLAWKRMSDPGDSMKYPHDFYLKQFALKAPRLDYDTIIFDEAQDANPVTLQIIKGQKHAGLLCIGDRHQSIYQFRGSVNAMETLALGATHFHLSQTFRFGPKVAEVANTILSELKGETKPIRGMGQDGAWNPNRNTVLSRTNAELFRMAAPLRGEGVHWVGGKEDKFGNWIDGCNNYKLEAIVDAYHLYARERHLIQNQLVKSKFASWDEYVNYAEAASDGEARVVVKVVEEFSHEIPDLVADIKKNAVRDSKDADLTLTTVHRSKGLEWDSVQISDDFEVLEETEAKLASHANAVIPVQDINLLYVGVTRAKTALKLNTETQDWLTKLPEHRARREAAKIRLQADLNRVMEQRRAMQAAG